MSDNHSSRFENFLSGAIAGSITATLFFGAAYKLSDKYSRSGSIQEKIIGFLNYVHWHWFLGIALFFAMCGFVFNTRFSFSPWLVIDWFQKR